MMQNLSQSWLWPAFTLLLRCKVPPYIFSWVLIKTMMKWNPTKTRQLSCPVLGYSYSTAQLQGPGLKTLQHRREINKKTRSGGKKLEKQVKKMKKVRSSVIPIHTHQTGFLETCRKYKSTNGELPCIAALKRPSNFWGEIVRELEPLREEVIIGSQDHNNATPIARHGIAQVVHTRVLHIRGQVYHLPSAPYPLHFGRISAVRS